jgi:hypothetical protein
MGCAHHAGVPEPAVHDGTPHISWTISVGNDENPDRTTVCQSDPAKECVTSARRGNERKLGHVDVYFHPARVETAYSGTVQVGFFDGPAEQHRSSVAASVKANDSPRPFSTTDLLTTTPGTYALVIDLVATATGNGQKQNIRQEVKVTVK